MVIRSVLLALVPAVLILGAAATAAAENVKNAASAPQILATSQVFKYPLSDPYDLKNLHGFNHAPSIARMADGKLIAAWFSGPFEASVHQVILASTSNDDGKTWSEAQVLQDTPRVSDFDAAFIQDSARTWM